MSKVLNTIETEVAIFVNPNKQFQEFLGIGGAITDASAEVFSKLSLNKQNELLNAYFTAEGINYNIIRTSIHIMVDIWCSNRQVETSETIPS